MRSLHVPLVAIALASTLACPRGGGGPDAGVVDGPALTGISPRTVSNQTATPVSLVGRGFAQGQKLRLGARYGQELAVVVDDNTHAHALIPAGLALDAAAAEATVPVTLVDAQGAPVGAPIELVIVNDTGFVDVT